ncbi:MAG: hypothetical protein AB7T10_04520 [bacterium]
MNSDFIKESYEKLHTHLQKNDYTGFDPFDGLNSYLNFFTFKNKYLQIGLQQTVRRLPFNIRPLIGIKKSRSTKGVAFCASGLLAEYRKTKDNSLLKEGEELVKWVLENKSSFFKNYSWGNHFDYTSRVFYLPKGMPTVVWTGLIGSILVEYYNETKKDLYLDAIKNTAKFIIEDLPLYDSENTFCISYIPYQKKNVHNANVIGASFLAQAKQICGVNTQQLDKLSMAYTAKHQHKSGAWWYGQRKDMHWIDNFHTGYVLDAFQRYRDASKDNEFDENIKRGFSYYRENFFDGDIPKYYFDKTYPIDIQCASQSIETLVNFKEIDKAHSVALWTIENMQDKDGFFYFRKYKKGENKTDMMHWGQGTMLRALGRLLEAI